MTTFETAKSYKIDGCDRYETPEECLTSFVDDTIDERGFMQVPTEITVNAYALADREHVDLDNMSDDMMTTFEEAYADANLGLTDNIDRLKDHDAYRRCKSAIWTALAEFAETLPVTKLADKPVASRTYTADEVIAVVRELKPEWFKEVG